MIITERAVKTVYAPAARMMRRYTATCAGVGVALPARSASNRLISALRRSNDSRISSNRSANTSRPGLGRHE